MLLRALKDAAAAPFHDRVYAVRYGLARGLLRRGGLGFLAPYRALGTDEAFLSGLRLVGSTVYDVGCLEGLYTLFFARAVGPEGRVVAFEPNPTNCRAIRDHVELNGFANVRLEEVGLGATPGQAELVMPRGLPGQGTVRDDLQQHYLREGAVRVPVQIERLDRIVRRDKLPPPHLIKIDVEGFELQVLRGAVQTLRTFKPQLFIELHGLEHDDRTANVREVIDLLASVGYASPRHVESGQTVGKGVPADAACEGHLWFE